jgi:uncharacterized secreted protein with C-terminal beta-propeller domain
MLRKSILLSTVFIVPFVFADDSSEVKALKKDMPQDVAVVIGRIVECNHWGGEEPANKARAEEINKAIARLQCNSIEQDQAKLAKTYQNNYEVKVRLQKAKELF